MKLTRASLQVLSRMRRREARLLLNAKMFAGAYYLTGYSVECALKAWYDGTIDVKKARDLYQAATGRNGVLAWLRQNW